MNNEIVRIVLTVKLGQDQNHCLPFDIKSLLPLRTYMPRENHQQVLFSWSQFRASTNGLSVTYYPATETIIDPVQCCWHERTLSLCCIFLSVEIDKSMLVQKKKVDGVILPGTLVGSMKQNSMRNIWLLSWRLFQFFFSPCFASIESLSLLAMRAKMKQKEA